MNSTQQGAYETVAIADDREHDNDERSSTEVDESLMGDEKWNPLGRRQQQRQRSKKSTFISLLRGYRWMINTVLLLVITVLLTILLLQHRRTGAEFQVGGDFTGAGPTIGTKIVKFESDMSFAPMEPREFFSNETLARWNTLMPVGTGWGSGNETFFTTSMTHQLHCVFMMGRIFNGLMLNITDNLPSDWHFHFLHCIDYLRQAIMCSGDVAMEAHEPDETDDTGPLDGGWNAHHVCKDYGQVIKYLERQIKDGVRVVLPIDD